MFLSFISFTDKSLTSFVDCIDNFFLCSRGQIEIIYLPLQEVRAVETKAPLPGSHDIGS